jgi:acyl-CoA synthetase (AMP-forming)/AMP-acid ligase II
MLDVTLNRSRPAALIFREACKVHSASVALICAGRSWTFEHLWRESAQVASVLANNRARPAACIASWSPNAAEALIVQWGAILAGAQVTHLDPDWEAAQAQAVLRNLNIDYLFVRAFHEGKQYPAMIKAMRAECAGLGTVVTHGREPRFERVLRGGWLDFLDSGKPANLPAVFSAEMPVLAFFGDTELEEHLAGEVGWSLAGHVRSNRNMRPVCVAVPCWQPVGLSLVLHAHLCGKTIVLTEERTDPAEIQKVARQADCEFVVAMPTVARAACGAGPDKDQDRPRWIPQTLGLAEEMDYIVQDIGLVYRSVSSNANLG